MSLRKAREAAMQFLYGFEMTGDKDEDSSEESETQEPDEAKLKLNSEQQDYLDKVRELIPDKLEQVDKILESNLFNWKLSRLSRVDLAILRLAILEAEYMDLNTPPKLLINEMVEIAHKYSDSKSARFINGVLAGYFENKGIEGFHVDRTDQVLRAQREEEEKKAAEEKAKSDKSRRSEHSDITPLNVSIDEPQHAKHKKSARPIRKGTFQASGRRKGVPRSGKASTLRDSRGPRSQRSSKSGSGGRTGSKNRTPRGAASPGKAKTE